MSFRFLLSPNAKSWVLRLFSKSFGHMRPNSRCLLTPQPRNWFLLSKSIAQEIIGLHSNASNISSWDHQAAMILASKHMIIKARSLRLRNLIFPVFHSFLFPKATLEWWSQENAISANAVSNFILTFSVLLIVENAEIHFCRCAGPSGSRQSMILLLLLLVIQTGFITWLAVHTGRGCVFARCPYMLTQFLQISAGTAKYCGQARGNFVRNTWKTAECYNPSRLSLLVLRIDCWFLPGDYQVFSWLASIWSGLQSKIITLLILPTRDSLGCCRGQWKRLFIIRGCGWATSCSEMLRGIIRRNC